MHDLSASTCSNEVLVWAWVWVCIYIDKVTNSVLYLLREAWLYIIDLFIRAIGYVLLSVKELASTLQMQAEMSRLYCRCECTVGWNCYYRVEFIVSFAANMLCDMSLVSVWALYTIYSCMYYFIIRIYIAYILFILVRYCYACKRLTLSYLVSIEYFYYVLSMLLTC